MSPDRHLRALRDPDRWDLGEEAVAGPARPSAAAHPIARGPVLVTAVVAASVAIVGGAAVALGLPPSRQVAGAPGTTPSAEVPAPSATPTDAAPSPVGTPTPTPRPSYEYLMSDPADAARGRRTLQCYHEHGVRIVELTEPDAHGISYIAYGGPKNDRRSIELGLRYQDLCDREAASGE